MFLFPFNYKSEQFSIKFKLLQHVQNQGNNKSTLETILIGSMCLPCKPKKVWNSMVNRETSIPISFNSYELNQLRRKYDSIAQGQYGISRTAFKENMGILGLRTAQLFSDRLFASFDMDNDHMINFNDFVEYMEILKNGKEKDKAYISFRMIDTQKKRYFNRKDFHDFMTDFLSSWSAITNSPISIDIQQRTKQYVKSIFAKVQQRKGDQNVSFDYYYKYIYKDNQFISAFQFITRGVANFFITKTSTQKEQKFEKQILKIYQSLTQIYDTLYPNGSFYMGDIGVESRPNMIPQSIQASFPIKLNLTNMSQKKPYQSNFNYSHDKSFQYSNKNMETTMMTNAAQKKLNNVREKFSDLMDEVTVLKQKIDQQKEEGKQLPRLVKAQMVTAANVHKNKKKQTYGQMVFIGDTSWNLVLNMMIGIQMAVRSVKGYQEMIYEQPKDFKLKYYFELIPRRFGGQQNKNLQNICKFTDYAPNTFNHIRKIFKIDNQEYIKSIGPDKLLASLLMGEMSSMTELTSQGKSGSFFYYTADGLYMLKTIHHRQYRFLKEILEDYYHYLVKNPRSFIIKFFGLHKLVQRTQTGKEVRKHYFVIMANVFNTQQKIIQRFDLKGSSYGRYTPESEGQKATKKDMNFLQRSPFVILQKDRNEVLQILRMDSQFFSRHNVIDYSLLVGVINKEQGSKRNSTADSKIEQGGDSLLQRVYNSTTNNQKYILGVIDILTEYNTKKKMQYCFKKMFYGEGISAVPPDVYSTRFYNFMRQKVFVSQFQQTELS